MKASRSLLPLLAFGATVATAAPAVASTPVLTGSMTGGTFTLGAQKKALGSVSGLCLELTPAYADGFPGSTAGGCAAGSLKRTHYVFSVTGRDDRSYLIGGVTVARARRVKVTFADGKHLNIRTSAPPKAYRRAFGTRVHVFAGDLGAVSTATVKSARAYDRRGRVIR